MDLATSGLDVIADMNRFARMIARMLGRRSATLTGVALLVIHRLWIRIYATRLDLESGSNVCYLSKEINVQC